MKHKFMLLLCLLCTTILSVSAQTRQLRGKVTDAQSGEPLSGVTIVAVQGQQVTSSDNQGGFQITVPTDETALDFSFVGYETRRIAVTGSQTDIQVQLTSDEAFLEEVVVTGYQTERKKDLTGAVHIADVDEMKKQTVANPMKALQGQVPGMLVTGNGAPSSPTTIRIRGIGTLNNNDPLYIIDGVPTKAGMHELNQADIESIQVLKDASSASIYGSRAANGVIIITTKRGKQGGVQVSANAFGAISSYVNRVKMLDTEGYGQVQWQAYVNSGFDPNTNTIGYDYDWNTDPNTTQPVLHKMYVPNYLD